MAASWRDRLRVTPGERPGLAQLDCRSTPGAPTGGKQAALGALAGDAAEVADLQARLWAQGSSGSPRRLLVVLQGMDTSGKDGTVRHVVGGMNPAGCVVTSFDAPTPTELRHDFLWRITRALPGPGVVGVFNRSHYEDVLIVRVHDLVPEPVWQARYEAINAWEARLVARGTTLVKICLAISADEQRERLLARLDDPTKQWKANPADVTERQSWPAYLEAYDEAIARCSTADAPWYVVPADRKWYRNLAVDRLLLETLRAMDLQWPAPRADLDAMRASLRSGRPCAEGVPARKGVSRRSGTGRGLP